MQGLDAMASETGFASATVESSDALRPQRVELRVGPGATLDARVEARIVASETLEDVARYLKVLLFGGFSVWTDGRLLEPRVFVDTVGSLRIVIHTREHGPPHFHVTAPGIDASFAVEDGSHLTGRIGDKEIRLVQYWHASARPLLVRIWNETRPSDCPVGPIDQGSAGKG